MDEREKVGRFALKKVLLEVALLVVFFSITHAAIVEGVVQSEDGRAVAGASVYVEDYCYVTDSNGKFRISGVNAGKHIVKVEAEGFFTYLNVFNFTEGVNSVLITLKRKPVRLKVAFIVRDFYTQEPVKSAKISVRNERITYKTKTGIDGTAVVSGLVPGRLKVEINKEGFIPYSKELYLSSNIALEVDLKRVGRAYPLKIKVVDENYRPVKGATVTIAQKRLVTGKFGIVNLSLPVGAYLVEAEYGDKKVADVIHVTPHNRIFLLVLKRVNISGKTSELFTLKGVIKVDGIPVEGAMVVWGEKTSLTDSRGRWVLTEVPEGLLKLKVFIPTEGKRMEKTVWIWAKREEPFVEIDIR